MKISHALKAIYWHFFILRLALRWVPRFNIGDVVIHKGRRWALNQGVDAPRWSMISLPDRADYITVCSSEFRKERALRNYLGSFKSGWRFYMQNWYGIWMNGGIQPWMRECRIWAKE